MSGPSTQGASDGSDSDNDWLMELCTQCPELKKADNINTENDNHVGDGMEVDSLERLLHEQDCCTGDAEQISLKEAIAFNAQFCTERRFERFQSAASRMYDDYPSADRQGPFMMIDGQRQQLVSANYYKMLVPAALHGLPRLEAVMRSILQDPQILLEFSASHQLASKVLSHAVARIRNLISLSLTYKIGLTYDPAQRWRFADHAYCRQSPRSFATMRLLAVVEHGETAAFIEASLIASFREHSGCKNIAGGGETTAKIQGPFFVYAVASA